MIGTAVSPYYAIDHAADLTTELEWWELQV
jgi:hypothetical protein